jgi:hypothetical protein
MLEAVLNSVQILCLVILIALKARRIYDNEQESRSHTPASYQPEGKELEEARFVSTFCHYDADKEISQNSSPWSPRSQAGLQVADKSTNVCMLCERGHDVVG